MNARPRSIEVAGLAHNAPIPLGARVGALVCSSGIAGKDAASGALPEDADAQVRNAFANLRTFLEAAGARLRDVCKLTVYVRDNAVRDAINREWNVCFPDPADRPARHILTYDLQHGMRIQLEVMALIQPNQD